MMNSTRRNFLILALLLLLVQAIFFFGGVEEKKKVLLGEEKAKQEFLAELDSLGLSAKAVSVINLSTNEEIYSRNDKESLPIASLTKVMTVATALNSRKKSDLVPITFKSLMQESDYGFFVNEKFDVEDLSKFTLIGSANDGAYALHENSEFFLEMMNTKAKKIGMENTLFLNSTGLDLDSTTPGAFSSAKDVNIMNFYALRSNPEVFVASSSKDIEIVSSSGFRHKIYNTNVILEEIPNLVFSKTGMTSLAGGNLSIIYKDKNEEYIAITVLGSTKEGRFTDMLEIVNFLEAQ